MKTENLSFLFRLRWRKFSYNYWLLPQFDVIHFCWKIFCSDGLVNQWELRQDPAGQLSPLQATKRRNSVTFETVADAEFMSYLHDVQQQKDP